MRLGKYELGDVLGRGGFGTVYRAVDLSLEREVAVKVLHPQLTVDPDFIERFRREARLLAQLDNANIVPVYEVGEIEGRFVIVMKLLKGRSLVELIRQGALAYPPALQILRDVCNGLQAAHARSWVHRDLKPGNILLDEHGTAVLTDLGLMKAAQVSSSASSSLGGVGTPFYRAPELWRGKPPASPATDVYALGCILYEMLTGKVLFSGDTPDEILTKHLIDGPGFATDWPPVDAPAGVKEIVERALERDPDKRYSDAGAFYQALLDAQGEEARKAAVEKARLEAEEKTRRDAREKERLRLEAEQQAGEKRRLGEEREDRETAARQEEERRRAEQEKLRLQAEDDQRRAQAQAQLEEERRLLVQERLRLQAKEAQRQAEMRVRLEEERRLAEERKALAWKIAAGAIVLFVLVGGGIVSAILLAIKPAATLSPATAVATNGIANKPTEPVSTEIPVLIPTMKPTKTLLPSQTPASQLTPVASLGIGSTQVSPKDGMVQVYVPAGDFLMGSDPAKDSLAQSDEQPQHTVYLDAYWIDKYEVTNAQYAGCVAGGQCTPPHATGSSTRASYYGNSQYADYPVIYVDWNQASAYCTWAGRKLPSEAQWEKAARGEDGHTYPWGNTAPDASLVNYNGNKGDTTAVGSYPSGASPYGALDMAGNVWEWVNDWYSDSYYQQSPSRNPTGPTSGEYRVLRGGSWSDNGRDVRSAARDDLDPPDVRYNGLGFRCAVSP